MSALSAYLAKNYLNASNSTDQERPKKRRKKDKAAPTEGTLLIADDEDLLLSNSSRRGAEGNEDDDGLGRPSVYDGNVKSAEFRRKKASGWKTVSEPTAANTHTSSQAGGGGGGDDDDGAEADRILADAAAAEDERMREIEMDDAPAIVDDAATHDAPRMESGVRPGLQTAADTARLAEKEERERRAEEKRLRKQRKEEPEEETIYRDATGRRIDVSMKRAEARQKEIEKLKEEKRAKEEAMGDVQRKMKEEKKVELEEAKFLTLGRDVDDEEMNERLKDVVRWDDPMAAYMASKEGAGKPAATGPAAGKGGPAMKEKKKVYQGSAAPNRYGIQPGWRWDGVDRGNGFEKDWFQARSKRSRNDELAYQWQMDE